MKKKLIILFFLLIDSLGILIAQEDKLLSPAAMKADADFYFESLYREHPNPYYYCSLEEFENKKDNIYSQLDKPLTRAQFLWIMGEITSCVDKHSWIHFYGIQRWEKKDTDNLQLFFPPVKLIKGKLFLADNIKNEIIEINGLAVDSILSTCKKYFNWKLPLSSNIAFVEAWITGRLLHEYNIAVPYEVKFNNLNKPQIINGISLKETLTEHYASKNIRGCLDNIVDWPYQSHYYKIYPSHSIAIFYINTFAEQFKDNFNDTLTKFMNKINSQHIKYVFYDLSKNQGGTNIGQFNAFDVVKHDTIYYRLTEINRNNSINRKYKVNDILLKPNYGDDIIPNERQLFVIQGNMTESGAAYFCRVFAHNKLGVLVGQDAGEPTKAFSVAHTYTMPNSKFNFPIAETFVDFSDYFEGETLKPDIYWDVHHNREFTENDLWGIINQWKKNKNLRTN
jgi:hypothetical protein